MPSSAVKVSRILNFTAMLGNLSDGTILLDQIQLLAPELRGTTRWNDGPLGVDRPRFEHPSHSPGRHRQIGGSLRRLAAAFAPGLAGEHDPMDRDGAPFA